VLVGQPYSVGGRGRLGYHGEVVLQREQGGQVALVFVVWGAVRGTPHGPATFGVQAAGAFAFGGLALAGLAVDPDLGRYLVAASWFFHGVWDFVHMWLDKVVARTFAEWCGVIDVLVAVELLFLV
jgi:hypothetical protein